MESTIDKGSVGYKGLGFVCVGFRVKCLGLTLYSIGLRNSLIFLVYRVLIRENV